jgi:CIC family chloride channel protein
MANFQRKLIVRLYKIRRSLLNQLQLVLSRFRRAEHIFMIVSAIIIGTLGAFGAIGFRYLLKLGHRGFFHTWDYSLEWLYALPWWERLLLPVVGGLLVGPIVTYVANEVKGSGIPEVMESVAVRSGMIRPRVIISKILAATFTISSGGSAGREGPIVHIGSAIGSAIGQLLDVSAKRLRTFVGCGAAAAIAATFNAPIAGALFAVEVIIGDFGVTQFSPIVISSVVATVISRHYIGDFPAFQVPPFQIVSAYEFLPYALLGILAGLMAVSFITLLYRSVDWFEQLAIPPVLKPAFGGLIVGCIGVFLPQVFGVGYDSINQALWGNDVSWLLLVLLLAKIVATSATLGSGGSGGVFAPSLFMGAMLGALVGDLTHSWQPALSADASAYALVGMGAMVAGTTHAPISAILIIFELTNDYRVIAPLMLSCIMSVLLATYLKKESIYTMKLRRKGLNIFEGRDINILKKIYVADVLNTDIECVKGNSSFTEIIRKLIASPHHEFFVTNDRQELIGTFSADEIKQFLKDETYLTGIVIAADIAHPPGAVLYPDDNLDLVMHHFGRLNIDELPVVESRENKRLIGSVLQKDVIDAYNREIFKHDLAGGMHSVVTAVSKDRTIELAEGYVMAEIEPPRSFIGKTIKQLNIRNRYKIEIILVRKAASKTGTFTSRPGALPLPDYRIEDGDRLLIMGLKRDVAQFQ